MKKTIKDAYTIDRIAFLPLHEATLHEYMHSIISEYLRSTVSNNIIRQVEKVLWIDIRNHIGVGVCDTVLFNIYDTYS